MRVRFTSLSGRKGLSVAAVSMGKKYTSQHTTLKKVADLAWRYSWDVRKSHIHQGHSE